MRSTGPSSYSSGGVNRGPARPSRVSVPNFVMIVVTMFLGIGAWLVCLPIYHALIDVWSTPVVIGLLFAILALVVMIGILILSSMQGNFEANIFNGGSTGSAVVCVAVILVVIFLLGMLFQWIYGMHFDKELQKPSSYVFLIDDSGSMEGNDPTGLRYEALDQVLADMPEDFTYMVYAFSDGVTMQREMLPISAGKGNLTHNNYGGTAIKGVLNQAISDYENGVWEGGNAPRVILLTDGYATDLGLFSTITKTLKNYSKHRISVSTVGLGDVDRDLMTTIAAKTGGVFVDVNDAALLADAMSEAASTYSAGDILSARNAGKLGFLFGFLRVLFLSILGAVLGLGCAVAYGSPDSATLTVVASAIQSVLGALMMELGTAAGLPAKICWFVLWLLLALTICTCQTTYRRSSAGPSRGVGKSSQRLSGF